jgi:hypothetical protein
MIGLPCTRVAAHTEHSSVFEFEDVSLAVESLWRITLGGTLRLTSADDGQQFGLPAPVNANEKAAEYLRGRRIQRVRVDETRGDLAFEFDGGALLETITDSSGYEAWTLRAPQRLVVAASGGRVHDLSPEV